MGKTNQCCIENDEILAEEVRQYPFLYDKSSSDSHRGAGAFLEV